MLWWMGAQALNQRASKTRVRIPGGRWLAHAVLAALVFAYVGLLAVRRLGDTSTLIDGWGVNALELFAGLLCLRAMRVHGRGRRVPLLLGLGAFCWATG